MKPLSRAGRKLPVRKSAAAPPAKGAALADATGQLAAIVEHSHDAIFSRNPKGVITTWNAAAERIFGYSAKEIIGRSSRVLLPHGQRDEFHKLLAGIRRGEVVERHETPRLRKDGKLVHVSLTLSPVRDSRRRVIGFSTIARDISDERRTIEMLARREHELQDLFDEASVGIVLTARDGRILRSNRAFFEMLDRPPAQVIGHPLGEFHLDPAAVARMLLQLAERQTLHNVSTEFLARSGTLRHVLVDANALWESGRFVHSRWFVRDISRRKQLERELLEMSERERRLFAQELHDGLGQQLGGVAYLSNVLREKLAERNAPEAAEAARIFGLVRDAIEQIRRVSRGLYPIRPELEGLMTALDELAGQTTDVFHVRCRFLCPKPVLLGDAALAGHLYRIAQEAVNNALKHANPRTVSISLRSEDDRVILSVKDDGSGIGLLPPLRQGLGLHIMQYRAGLVRGALTVQSRLKKGTEVICSAPCQKTKARKRGRQPVDTIP